MDNPTQKRKREESSKSENNTIPTTSRGEDGRPACKKRRVDPQYTQTVCSKPTTGVGLKKVSNRGTKRKAQSYLEPPRKRQKTESVTVRHVFCSPELQPPTLPKPKHVLEPISREEYEKHYVEISQLGEGGYGTVYSGYRRDDFFPVAVKHINKSLVKYQPVEINGELCNVPMEMALMVMAAGDSVGGNAVVAPLAWANLDYEVLLIMERPENCVNLFQCNNGQITEGLAKELMRQLVEGAIQIHKAGVFHRDLKLENILIQFSDAWHVPRVRIIDFGCGWFVQPGYCRYAGTFCFSPPEFNYWGLYKAGPTTVWQLGCILLEILSQNTDLFKTGLQFCEGFLPQTIMGLNVTEECKDFLMNCSIFNPDQRLSLGQMLWHPWFQ